MCASYGALESTLVSTRSTVPGTLARAAALTLAATSPVSAASVFPLTLWRLAWAAEGVDVDEPEVAALATVAPPTAVTATAAAVTSLVRTLDTVGDSLWWGTAYDPNPRRFG